MRKVIGLGLALVTGLVSTAALAQEAAPTFEASSDKGIGLSLGLRAGYALPLGNVAKDVKMSDSFSGAIPFQLDALYRVTPNIGLGLYFSYGIVSLKDVPSGVDASAHWLKYGIQAQYRLDPEASSTPWFGLGIGLESLSQSASAGGMSMDSSLSGIEFAHIMAGYDFTVADKLSVGPFVDFSLGQYSSGEVNGTSKDIEDKGMHQWLFIGVRGNYDL